MPLSVRRSLITTTMLFVGAFASACGAKTGLEVPDAQIDMVDNVDMGLPCIEIPIIPEDQPPIQVPISFETRLQRADIVFLIDVTASMTEEIDQIRDKLRDVIAPAIEAEVPDIQFGVASYADFPVEPFGEPDVDHAFSLALPMTPDLSAVQAAVNQLEIESGNDEPEAQVEALYQIATGEGLGEFIPASFGCARGGIGYPCFRRDSLPLVFFFTDASFHNGPGGTEPYDSRLRPLPHTYIDAIRVLRAQHIRVLGFFSGGIFASPEDLTSVVRDTGAFSPDGEPLVFDIGVDGAQLDTSVVQAIQGFAEGVTFDVDAILSDPNPDDGVDARMFIEDIVPLRAEPMSGIASIDVERRQFLGVKASTRVIFEIRLRNDLLVPQEEPQSYDLDIVFRGDGRTVLGRERVRLVVPAISGAGCGNGSSTEIISAR